MSPVWCILQYMPSPRFYVFEQNHRWLVIDSRDGSMVDSYTKRTDAQRLADEENAIAARPRRSSPEMPLHAYLPNRKPVTYETVGAMSAPEINRRLDALDVESSKINREFIDAGRGSERPSETRHMTDPLALRAIQNRKDSGVLHAEIAKRYGPGAPSRLPGRVSKTIHAAKRNTIPKLASLTIDEVERLSRNQRLAADRKAYERAIEKLIAHEEAERGSSDWPNPLGGETGDVDPSQIAHAWKELPRAGGLRVAIETTRRGHRYLQVVKRPWRGAVYRVSLILLRE